MIADAAKLLDELRREPRETEWLEFKHNRFEADEVGRYISGLANAAMLENKKKAYLVFGIEDKTHTVLGTKVSLKDELVGNQLFELWISQMLHPHITLEFCSFEYQGKHVEMVVIHPGYIKPVRFKNEAYVRINSAQKLLRDYEERERALWAITSKFCFEDAVADTHLREEEVFDRFAVKGLLSGLYGKPTDANIEKLLAEGLLLDDRQGGYDVTNLMVILCTNDIWKYESLREKAPRVTIYRTESKLKGQDEQEGRYGYGQSFSKLLGFIMDRVPHKEEIKHGVRTKVFAIPEIAVREFIANVLIHQDLTINGGAPRIEIFPDRIKITNPGRPLISTDRFIDAAPRSRNEKLSRYMRRLGLCEARGSGVDRALDAIEGAALPAPLFQEIEDSTVVTVYGPKPFASMTKDERLRACFQHAALKTEANSMMSNQSLRTRLGLTKEQYPQVSLVIRDAIEAGLIKPLDEDQPNRTARYVPWWWSHTNRNSENLPYPKDDVFQ